MKPDTVKITNMNTTGDHVIYGLGDDSMVYVWNKIDGTWKLHVEAVEGMDMI